MPPTSSSDVLTTPSLLNGVLRTHRLIITPHLAPNGSHRDRFDAVLEATDEIVLEAGREVLSAGARALLERGYPEEDLLTCRHDHLPHDSFVPRPLGELAGQMIVEEDRQGLRKRKFRRGPNALAAAAPVAVDAAAAAAEIVGTK